VKSQPILIIFLVYDILKKLSIKILQTYPAHLLPHYHAKCKKRFFKTISTVVWSEQLTFQTFPYIPTTFILLKQ